MPGQRKRDEQFEYIEEELHVGSKWAADRYCVSSFCVLTVLGPLLLIAGFLVYHVGVVDPAAKPLSAPSPLPGVFNIACGSCEEYIDGGVAKWNSVGLTKFSQASFILQVVTTGCQSNPPPNCPCIQYNPQSVISNTQENLGPNWVNIKHYIPIKFGFDGNAVNWVYPTKAGPTCNIQIQVYSGSTTVRKTPIATMLQPYVTNLPIQPHGCPKPVSGVYAGVTTVDDAKVKPCRTACEAAHGLFSLQATNGSYACVQPKFFSKVCIRVELNAAGGWQESSTALGAGAGCYFQGNLTTKVDDGRPFEFSRAMLIDTVNSTTKPNIAVEIRSTMDPYLYWVRATRGSGDFDKRKGNQAMDGTIIMIVGCVFCVALITWTIVFCRWVFNGSDVEKPENRILGIMFETSQKLAQKIPSKSTPQVHPWSTWTTKPATLVARRETFQDY